MNDKHLLLSQSPLSILPVALLKYYFAVADFRGAILKYLEIVMIELEVILGVEGIQKFAERVVSDGGGIDIDDG